jgi:hypothetical protein
MRPEERIRRFAHPLHGEAMEFDDLVHRQITNVVQGLPFGQATVTGLMTRPGSIEQCPQIQRTILDRAIGRRSLERGIRRINRGVGRRDNRCDSGRIGVAGPGGIAIRHLVPPPLVLDIMD